MSKKSKKAKQPSRNRRNIRHITRRAFQSAVSGRLTGDWLSFPQTAQTIINRYQRTLVARSRDQVLNNDYAKSFVRICKQNIVGAKGVALQAQAKDATGALDLPANDAIELAFNDWCRSNSCDIAGLRSFRLLQEAAVTSAAKDGEFFFRKIFGSLAGEYGFALQSIDPQRCDPTFNLDRTKDGGHIKSGIEYNKYGRPLSYYFKVDSSDEYSYPYNGSNYTRVPASEIIHGYIHEMEGQTRGLPWMSTSLFRLKQLQGFEDAAVVNARIGASKMGFVQWREGEGPNSDKDGEEYDCEITVEPGQFEQLPSGAELREWNPQYPTGEFEKFNKAMLRGISAGLGVLYNNLASDLEGVNFSSIRQGTLDERDHWQSLQSWLIESFIEPVFEAWLPYALLKNKITINGKPIAADIDKCRNVSWQPRRWQWIDPRADIMAAIAAKNSMLMSPGQIIREQGKDPSNVWNEIARDINEMKKAGIPAEYIQSAMLDNNLQAAMMAQDDDSTDKDIPDNTNNT